jgi:hypothetical protein
VLRVILQAAKRELGLSGLATEGVKDFDESEHETYSEEEPERALAGGGASVLGRHA